MQRLFITALACLLCFSVFGQEQTPESLIPFEKLYEAAYQKASAGSYSAAALEFTKCIDLIIEYKYNLEGEGFDLEEALGLVYYARGVCYGNLSQMDRYCSDLSKAVSYNCKEAVPYYNSYCSN